MEKLPKRDDSNKKSEIAFNPAKTLRVAAVAAGLLTAPQSGISESHAGEIVGEKQTTIEMKNAEISTENRKYLDTLLTDITEQKEKRIAELKKFRLIKFEKAIKRLRTSLFEIEEHRNDTQYLENLLFLKDSVVDVKSVANRISPIVLKNKDFLLERLGNIPEELHGKFKIALREFSNSKNYDPELYKNPDFVDTANELSARGILWNSAEISYLIKIGKNKKVFFDAITSCNRKGVKLSVLDLKKMSEEKALSTEYMDAYVRLRAIGAKKYILRDYLTMEKVKSKSYLKNLILLNKAGFERNTPFSLLERLSLKLGENNDFVQNMLYLKTKMIKIDAWIIGKSNIDRLQDSNLVSTVEKLHDVGFPDLDVIRFVTKKHDSMTLEKLASKEFMNAFVELKNASIDIEIWDINYITMSRTRESEYIKILKNIKQDDFFTRVYRADIEYLQSKINNLDELLDDIVAYSHVLENADLTPLAREILKDYKQLVYELIINKFNQRHEGQRSSHELRVEEIKDLSPRVLFDLIRLLNDEMYLSTFQLLLNGKNEGSQLGVMYPYSLMGRIAESGGKYNSILEFFQGENISNKDIVRFLEVLTQRGVLDYFMASIGDGQEQLKVSEMLFFGLESLDIGRAQSDRVFTLLDVVSSLEDDTTRTILLDKIHHEINKLELQIKNTDTNASELEITKIKSAIAWYKLVVVKYLQNLNEDERKSKLLGNMIWADGMYAEIVPNMQNIHELSKESLFVDINGVMTNLHQVYIYDDRGSSRPEKSWDGHLSVRSYMKRLGVKVGWDKSGNINKVSSQAWEVEHKIDDGYFILTREWTRDGTKYAEKLFINTPDKPDGATKARERLREVAGVKKVGEEDDKSKIGPPMIITEVGHSYNVERDGFKEVTPNVIFVNLRSCGGNKNMEKILNLNPNTLVWSTTGTGTELINNILAEKIHDTVRNKLSINFTNIHNSVEAFLVKEAKKDGKGSFSEKMLSRLRSGYVPPDKNEAAQISMAYKKIIRSIGAESHSG